MTLDEAIGHCEEKSCISKCGMEHKQLGEWLKELRASRPSEPKEQIAEARSALAKLGGAMLMEEVDDLIMDLEKAGILLIPIVK